MATDTGILTVTEHLPLINAALSECQQIMDECLKAGRCRINVKKTQADVQDALDFLTTLKQEYFPDET